MQLPDWVRYRRLSVKLVVAIVLLSSAVTLVVTSIQVLIEYRRDVHGLEQGLTDARSSFSQSLGASLWALDDGQLTLQLRGLHQLPHVDRVELTGDMELAVGEADGYRHRHEKAFPIVHRTADGVLHPLGEVRIDASLAAIHSRLWDRLTVILASQAFKTFVVSMLLLALIYYLAIRHLQSLARYARAIRLHRQTEPVLLSRAEGGVMRPDELDDVASAMNHAVNRMAEDMEDRRLAEAHHRLLSGALEQSPAGVLIMDRDGRLEFANPRFESLIGRACSDRVGLPCLGRGGWLTPRIGIADGRQDPWRAVESTGAWQGEIRLRRDDGQYRWARASLQAIDSGAAVHYVALVEDLTELRAVEERLDYRTHFDMLTGLPNRHLIQQLLTATIGSMGQEACAVILLDVDRFKAVNESIGPEAGDDALRTVATLLRDSSPADWQVGRFGNDEFIIVVPGAWRAADLRSRTEQLLRSLSEHGITTHLPFPLSAAAGIALCPEAGRTVPELLRAVDSALQAAKLRGPGSVTVYDPIVQQEARRRLMLDTDLHRALANGEFHLHYQPIVAGGDNTVEALEALVRWAHPDQGAIPPDTFIGMAEDNGLIVPLGEWVLRQALADIRRLRALPGRSNLRVSVNVSPAQLAHRGFAGIVETALDEEHLPGEALQLEITERTFLTGLAQSRQALDRMERRGVKITIDDFGTGYSALNHLRRLRVNGLKIDRTFIRDMFEGRQDTQLVRAITSLGHDLGLEVTAEGVETEEQLHFLQELGCELVQGFLLGRPQPLEDILTRFGQPHDHA
ncbi:EAL domain-containing protein [Aquisalimonas sp.]|uniref:bifunctional diguanylate cyclase/phosphodiesterase n=1 Tax=unclassified Aquisalimonas TaxID=2644645 RepID=UPI0025BDE2D0|nr:EAL domain-containing protein [Aquisalimonas sp.]